MFSLFVFIIFAKISWTTEHLLNSLDFCGMSRACVHDGLVICGQDGCQKRGFKDYCDMLEFNCDYGANYMPTLCNFINNEIIDTTECKTTTGTSPRIQFRTYIASRPTTEQYIAERLSENNRRQIQDRNRFQEPSKSHIYPGINNIPYYNPNHLPMYMSYTTFAPKVCCCHNCYDPSEFASKPYELLCGCRMPNTPPHTATPETTTSSKMPSTRTIKTCRPYFVPTCDCSAHSMSPTLRPMPIPCRPYTVPTCNCRTHSSHTVETTTQIPATSTRKPTVTTQMPSTTPPIARTTTPKTTSTTTTESPSTTQTSKTPEVVSKGNSRTEPTTSTPKRCVTVIVVQCNCRNQTTQLPTTVSTSSTSSVSPCNCKTQPVATTLTKPFTTTTMTTQQRNPSTSSSTILSTLSMPTTTITSSTKTFTMTSSTTATTSVTITLPTATTSATRTTPSTTVPETSTISTPASSLSPSPITSHNKTLPDTSTQSIETTHPDINLSTTSTETTSLPTKYITTTTEQQNSTPVLQPTKCCDRPFSWLTTLSQKPSTIIVITKPKTKTATKEIFTTSTTTNKPTITTISTATSSLSSSPTTTLIKELLDTSRQTIKTTYSDINPSTTSTETTSLPTKDITTSTKQQSSTSTYSSQSTRSISQTTKCCDRPFSWLTTLSKKPSTLIVISKPKTTTATKETFTTPITETLETTHSNIEVPKTDTRASTEASTSTEASITTEATIRTETSSPETEASDTPETSDTTTSEYPETKSINITPEDKITTGEMHTKDTVEPTTRSTDTPYTSEESKATSCCDRPTSWITKITDKPSTIIIITTERTERTISDFTEPSTEDTIADTTEKSTDTSKNAPYTPEITPDTTKNTQAPEPIPDSGRNTPTSSIADTESTSLKETPTNTYGSRGIGSKKPPHWLSPRPKIYVPSTEPPIRKNEGDDCCNRPITWEKFNPKKKQLPKILSRANVATKPKRNVQAKTVNNPTKSGYWFSGKKTTKQADAKFKNRGPTDTMASFDAGPEDSMGDPVVEIDPPESPKLPMRCPEGGCQRPSTWIVTPAPKNKDTIARKLRNFENVIFGKKY